MLAKKLLFSYPFLAVSDAPVFFIDRAPDEDIESCLAKAGYLSF